MGQTIMDSDLMNACMFVCLFNRSSVRNTLGSWWTKTQAKARARLKSLYKHAGYEIRTDKNRLKKKTS